MTCSYMMYVGVQSVASLDQLFCVGKLVRCKIVSIATKGAKKVVSLTINPQDVNKDVKLVKSGMVSLTRSCAFFGSEQGDNICW